ncbi:MAG TPA: DUF2975 domain-containing protein [Pilimelia sp.]|nr:DUF2975 domain-containing protein [Pilimelia sp.]
MSEGIGWLRRLRWLLAAAALAGLVALVAVAILALAGDWTRLDVPVDRVGGVRAGDPLPAGVQVAGDGTVQLQVPDPGWGQRLLSLAMSVPEIFVQVAVLWLAARLVGDAAGGAAFADHTAGAVRRLAAWCAVGGSVAVVIQEVATSALSATVLPSGWLPPVPLPVAWLVAGLVLAALSQVIARGSALRAELDEVV